MVGSLVGTAMVFVGVIVKVGVSVGVVTCPVPCRIRKIMAAPKPRIKTIRPKAAGRLSFNSGRCGPSTGFDFSLFAGVATEKFRPHTRQRVAFSLRRVPHVGQTFVVEFSGLIICLLT